MNAISPLVVFFSLSLSSLSSNPPLMIVSLLLPILKLEKLKTAFALETTSDDVSQSLLSIIESIVDEANVDSGAISSERDSTHLSMILEKLTNPSFHQPKHKKAAKAMTRILPFLTYGAENTSKKLIDFFKPHFELEKYKEGDNFYVDGFVEVAESIKQDRNGQKLREFMVDNGPSLLCFVFFSPFLFWRFLTDFLFVSLFLSAGLVDVFFDFIERHGPKPDQPAEQADSWKASFISLPVVPNILRVLTGLAKGNEKLRKAVLSRPNILLILHQIELVTSEKHIGIFFLPSFSLSLSLSNLLADPSDFSEPTQVL